LHGPYGEEGGLGPRFRLGIFCTLDHHDLDGLTTAARLRAAVEEAVQAERCGLESFWIAEHHFAAYGLAADPALLLSAIAERTGRLRLGTAVTVLPFHHPLRLAERFALLDQLSGGRVEFGVGSGYLQHEFQGFGVDPAERRARFDEALEIIRTAWRGGALRHEGAHFRIEAPPLNVLPLQPGGPPVHIGVTRPEAAPHVGRKGLALSTVPYIRMRSLAAFAAAVAGYRAALPPGAPGGVTAAVHVFCTAGPGDPARDLAEAALDRYLRTRVVPGARYGGEPAARDFVLFGDAAEVRAGLLRLAGAGADRILAITRFGGLDSDAARASVARLGALAAG
jgi:alkanesulfonate monooxygenase SsuD/methylene tetrahydromethanopterin reductase-like flavin-dependent oxidoreductase (luciferase family)